MTLVVVEDRVFCLGAPRHGTRYICDLLDASLDEAPGDIVHEVDTPHVDSVLYRRGLHDHDALVDEVQQARGSVWFEANHYLSFLVPVLQDAYPNAQYIHLVRDPRDWAQSMMSKFTSGRADPLDVHPGLVQELPCYIPGDYPAPILLKITQAWTLYHQTLMDHLPREDALLLHSQALFDGQLDALETYLDTPLPDQDVDPVGSQDDYKTPAWEDWSPDLHTLLYASCGWLMSKLGYPVPDSYRPPRDWENKPDRVTHHYPEPRGYDLVDLDDALP